MCLRPILSYTLCESGQSLRARALVEQCNYFQLRCTINALRRLIHKGVGPWASEQRGQGGPNAHVEFLRRGNAGSPVARISSVGGLYLFVGAAGEKTETAGAIYSAGAKVWCWGCNLRCWGCSPSSPSAGYGPVYEKRTLFQHS